MRYKFIALLPVLLLWQHTVLAQTPLFSDDFETDQTRSGCDQVYQNKVWYDQVKLEKNESSLSVRGLYVDDFSTILGNTAKENAVLSYALTHNFNYLALYELHYFDFNTAAHRDMLANFIRRAKTLYGIEQVGATGEIASFFSDRIIGQYQASRSDPLEKFNVLNLEFEFWSPVFTDPGGYYCSTYLQPGALTCDRSGAFTFYLQQLTALQQLCATHGLTCETEFGWFTQDEADQFVPLCDRILVHSYVPTAWVNSDPATFYNYTKDRLSYIANAAVTPPDVMVIFSSEDEFSGSWLNATTPPRMPSEAYNLYKTYYDAETAAWVSNLHQVGMQWFAYTFMPENGAVLPVEIIDFQGTAKPDGNWLSWETGVSQDIESIVPEHADNDTDFSPLGFLSAQDHFFVDKDFFPVTYYRLKFNESGGKTIYSPIISIQRNEAGGIEAYPNPAMDFIFFKNGEQEERVQLFNASGQKIMDIAPFDREGINVADLPKGVYFFKKENQLIKWVKQ